MNLLRHHSSIARKTTMSAFQLHFGIFFFNCDLWLSYYIFEKNKPHFMFPKVFVYAIKLYSKFC